ncbi:MAG: hypothetical protein R3A48_11075 [Polyangiales bacterium]
MDSVLRATRLASITVIAACDGSAVVGTGGDGGMDASIDVVPERSSACGGACGRHHRERRALRRGVTPASRATCA